MLREFKTIQIEAKDFVEDSSSWYFEGYVSTFGNKDYGNDVVVAGAFTESLLKQPSMPILWQHRMSEPIGKTSSMIQDNKGLKIGFHLPKDDDFVKGRVIPQVKIGSVREMSMGYWVDDYEEKDGVRYLKKCTIFEGSLVTKAMNSEAVLTAFKSLASMRDIEVILKDYGFSNNEAKTLISKVKEFSKLRDEGLEQRDADNTAEAMIASLKQFNQQLIKI